MRQERAALEQIMRSGKIPGSISQLFELVKDVGSIQSANGTLYFLDIPDSRKSGLPKNAGRHCTKAESLDTEFNRWLWTIGTNAPDLEETWKRGPTSQVLWDLLENAFSQEEKPGKNKPMGTSSTGSDVYVPTRDDIEAAYRQRCRPGVDVEEDVWLDWVESDLTASGKRLAPDWKDAIRDGFFRKKMS